MCYSIIYLNVSNFLVLPTWLTQFPRMYVECTWGTLGTVSGGIIVKSNKRVFWNYTIEMTCQYKRFNVRKMWFLFRFTWIIFNKNVICIYFNKMKYYSSRAYKKKAIMAGLCLYIYLRHKLTHHDISKTTRPKI